jgi:hypothetical protein
MASSCLGRLWVTRVEGKVDRIVAKEQRFAGVRPGLETLSVVCENCAKSVWNWGKRGSAIERKQSPELMYGYRKLEDG